MAKPTSKTAVVNLALRHLKNDPVTSIEPPDANSKAAAAGAAWYDQARRDTLEAHSWNFATKRAQLTAEVTDPAFEYAKQYELPNDFIRMGRVGLDWDDPITDYEIEENYIICDEESPLDIVYVSDFENVSKFSPKFITAMAFKLAQFMAYELTGNANLVQVMEASFDKEITRAASIDGQNRPTRRIQRSKVRAARQNTARNRDWRRWGAD